MSPARMAANHGLRSGRCPGGRRGQGRAAGRVSIPADHGRREAAARAAAAARTKR